MRHVGFTGFEVSFAGFSVGCNEFRADLLVVLVAQMNQSGEQSPQRRVECRHHFVEERLGFLA